MNAYGKLPQEKAMQTLIHDTNLHLANAHSAANIIEHWIRENNDVITTHAINVDQLMRVVLYLDKSKAGIKKTVDDYYAKFKSDFPE